MAPPFTFTFSGSKSQFAHHRQRLRRKRLIELDQANVIQPQPRHLQCLGNAVDRPHPHLLRQASGDRVGHQPRQRLNAQLPSRDAASISTAAAAPSDVCDELPAVTVPCA